LAEKSEKNICLWIFYKDLKKIAKFVKTILLSTKYFILKERNVVKYQKKAMSKIRIINLLKKWIVVYICYLWWWYIYRIEKLILYTGILSRHSHKLKLL
jgi:hypothetical protein